MKKLVISYIIFTVLWPLFFSTFSEENFFIPIPIRVAFLYLWAGFIILSLILVFMSIRKKKNTTHSCILLSLITLNVIIMMTNPFGLVTNFFG